MWAVTFVVLSNDIALISTWPPTFDSGKAGVLSGVQATCGHLLRPLIASTAIETIDTSIIVASTAGWLGEGS